MCPESSHGALAQILATDVASDVMRALSARERRYVMYYLLDRGRVSTDELGDVLAGWTAATERGVATAADRESLLVSLYHSHLPALVDAGLVEFDETEDVVTRASLSGSVRDLVRAVYRAERRSAVPNER